MDSQVLLTDLHYFGIPTAAFDFPLGVSVPIRTVPAVAEFCFLHPTVADLSLRRIADCAFVLEVRGDAFASPEVLRDLAFSLVTAGEATFPVSINQTLEVVSSVSEDGVVSLQTHQTSTIMNQLVDDIDTQIATTQNIIANPMEIDLG